MRDYRKYPDLYKHVGFFVIMAAVFILAFKLTGWAIWAQQCISASI